MYSFIKNTITVSINAVLKKQIFITLLFLILLAGIVYCASPAITHYGLQIFPDGIRIGTDPNNAWLSNGNITPKDIYSNGAITATLDANSKVPIANIYPPETTVELDDDETLTLPAITRGGILNVWTSTQYAEYFLKSDGTVEYIRMTAGCDDADTDVMTICVYKDGTATKLKNTSGGTLTYGYTLIKN